MEGVPLNDIVVPEEAIACCFEVLAELEGGEREE
jgi:hypothetical protein